MYYGPLPTEAVGGMRRPGLGPTTSHDPPSAPPPTRPEERRVGALLSRWGTLAAAAGLVGLLLAILGFLLADSARALSHFGPAFLWGTSWDPNHALFGAAPAIVGTLETSAIALALALPVALGAAIFAGELAPRRWRAPLATVVDLGAAVPSVVFGLWGILVVAPWMQGTVEPALARLTGGSGPFSGSPTGFDLLTASLVLAIMIVPTVSALARAALEAVPRGPREAALALGASRAEMVGLAVLGPARSGILAGVLLGLARALGEAIIVVSLIGNIYAFPGSLFASGQTLAGLVLNDAGAAGPAERSALVALGLVLLALSAAIQVAARLLAARRWRRPRATHGRHRSLGEGLPGGTPSPAPAGGSGSPRAVRPGARRILGAAIVLLTGGATALAIAPLLSVIATAVARGGSAVLTPGFFTSELPPACLASASASCPVGGIGPAIQGTILLVGLAALVAVPVGLLIGVYLSEYGRGRWAATVRFAADILVGLPSILIGLFLVLVLLASAPHLDDTAFAGAMALAVLMLPIVARTSEQALRAVPVADREAAWALGFPRHRTAWRIVVPKAWRGIVTGLFLAVARAGGETAAVVLTAFGSPFWFRGLGHPVAALAPLIFQQGVQSVYPNWQADAWGAALVLLALMLAAGLAGRWTLRGRAGPPEG
jgi:phosphate transport system permease protein